MSLDKISPLAIMLGANIGNCANNKMRKEEIMSHTILKTRNRLVCPSCNSAVHFQVAMDDIGTCPQCGEWLVSRGKWNRRLERLDQGPSNDFDESSDWELTLIKKIG